MKNRKLLVQVKQFLVKNDFPETADTAVILGSGLGGFADYIQHSTEISYQNISILPITSVQGHHGKLIYGTVENRNILVFSGRFHHYEGHSISSTVLPIQIASLFSVKKIIISNAAGAVNPVLKVGDLMAIQDIFRLFQKISAQSSKRFTYNLYHMADKAKEIAANTDLNIEKGTYLYVKGPSYETKAEIRAFQRLGVDVVGMSTVPELIEASRLNIPTAAISLITNMATGLSSLKLDHSEVEKAANRRKDDFAQLVIELIKKL